MDCPYADCNGYLIRLSEVMTEVEYPELDRNTHREVFRCTRCGESFYRSWQWEKLEDNV